jgi:hypothetical protein
MKNLFVILYFICFQITVIAGSKHKHSHHGHSQHAHVHGEGKLIISLDEKSKQIRVDFEAPSESIMGFEWAPQSDAEQGDWLAVKKLWPKEVISFSKKNNCTLKDKSINRRVDSKPKKKGKKKKSAEHSSVVAESVYQCEKFDRIEFSSDIVNRFNKEPLSTKHELKHIDLQIFGGKKGPTQKKIENKPIKLIL